MLQTPLSAPTRRRPWAISPDVVALLLWGLMILRYQWTGLLLVLLHPDFHWLAIGAGWLLVGMGLWRGWQWWQAQTTGQGGQHLALLPRQWSLGILIGVAMVGLIYVPRPFASETALARGIADPIAMTRSQTERFGSGRNPGERTLTDWSRVLSVYPEPDAYTGDPVNVSGFVVHPPNWDESHVIVARFVMTCCAADAYPIGLPVRVPQGRSAFPPDSWIQVQGTMATETLKGRRQLVIQGETLETIPEPASPYEF